MWKVSLDGYKLLYFSCDLPWFGSRVMLVLPNGNVANCRDGGRVLKNPEGSLVRALHSVAVADEVDSPVADVKIRGE